MTISNTNFYPEIQQISSLVLRTKYFSRSANCNFTFIAMDTDKKEIKIGIDGKLKKLTFFEFNKKYMAEGVMQD